jgi:O-methyltransferase/methyltransferase family protein
VAQKVAETTPDPRAELAGRIMGFMASQAVYVAAKLGIADLVGERAQSATELAEAVGADPDALYRLLRFLAGNGIFVEGEGGFANSELSELLRDAPGSSRDFALVFGEEFYPAFGETLRQVETGEPYFDAVFAASWDEYLAADPEKSTRFNRFMAGGKGMVADALAACAWRGDEIVVDVGGGNGALLQALLEQRPDLGGIVLDLPHVAAEAEERIARAGLVEGVVAPPNEPGMKLMDLLMLSIGGRERTEEEWRALIRAGGFELTAIRPAPFGNVLEASPT